MSLVFLVVKHSNMAASICYEVLVVVVVHVNGMRLRL
jgi:hypothetical protein